MTTKLKFQLCKSMCACGQRQEWNLQNGIRVAWWYHHSFKKSILMCSDIPHGVLDYSL